MATKHSVIVVLIVLSTLWLADVAMSQTNLPPPDTTSAATASPNEQKPLQPLSPPPFKQTGSGDLTSITQGEIFMSISVLILGIVVFILEFLLLRRSAVQADDILRVLGVTLIIVAALFTVAGAFKIEHLTPVIGLLGTIAGYLIGKEGTRFPERVPVTAASSAPGSAIAPESGGGAK